MVVFVFTLCSTDHSKQLLGGHWVKQVCLVHFLQKSAGVWGLAWLLRVFTYHACNAGFICHHHIHCNPQTQQVKPGELEVQRHSQLPGDPELHDTVTLLKTLPKNKAKSIKQQQKGKNTGDSDQLLKCSASYIPDT